MTKHTGSCHCGAVKFEAEVDLSKGASRCNCSICTKTSWLGTIVKPEQFRLVAGEDQLGSYEWGRKIAKQHFCANCGVYVFQRGFLEVLGGDYVSINLNTLDDVDVGQLPVKYWDGRHDNWMAGTRDKPWPVFT